MEKYKINWIAGLKGSAAILVFVHHFFLFFYPAFCNGSIESSRTSTFLDYKIAQTNFNILGWGGSFAVSLFYVISGFLIGYSFFVRNNKEIKAKSVLERYFKLVFPILMSSIVIFIAIKSRVFRTEALIDEYKLLGFRDYFANFGMGVLGVIKESFYTLFIEAGSEINPPLWTMQCELFFSVILMMYLSVFGKTKKRWAVYALTILFCFKNYFFCFIAGCIVCDLMFNYKELLEKINKWPIKLIVIGFGLYLASFTYIIGNKGLFNSSFMGNANEVYHNLAAVLVVLFVVLSNFTQKIFSLKPLVKLGDISFEIYAFHWILLQSLSKFVVVKAFYHINYFYSSMLSLLVTTAALIPLCLFFNKYIKDWTGTLTKKISNFVFEDK